MSGMDSLRAQVRDELQRAYPPAPPQPVLTVRSEADLQALVKLIREMGSNPLLADQLQSGVGRLAVQVEHGQFDGCACHANDDACATPSASAPMVMRPALGGLVTLARIQAANIPKGSIVLLDQDAIVTPQVKDWMRQNKVQAQRSQA